MPPADYKNKAKKAVKDFKKIMDNVSNKGFYLVEKHDNGNFYVAYHTKKASTSMISDIGSDRLAYWLEQIFNTLDRSMAKELSEYVNSKHKTSLNAMRRLSSDIFYHQYTMDNSTDHARIQISESRMNESELKLNIESNRLIRKLQTWLAINGDQKINIVNY